MVQKKLEGLLLLSVERTNTDQESRKIHSYPYPKYVSVHVSDIANMLLGLGTRLFNIIKYKVKKESLFILSPFKRVIIVYGLDVGQSLPRWTCTRMGIHAYIYFCWRPMGRLWSDALVGVHSLEHWHFWHSLQC